MKNPNEEIAAKGEQTVRIAVDAIRPSATNPRKTFAEGPLKELADNIKAHGQIQPGVVRLVKATRKLIEPDMANGQKWQVLDLKTNKVTDEFDKKLEAPARMMVHGEDTDHFELVVGERRWRACKLAGLKTYSAIVRELTDEQVVILQHLENLQREDLSPIEEGESYRHLIDSQAETVPSLEKKLNRSRSHIYQRMALAKLSPVARTAFENKLIDLSIAELVSKIPGQKLQEKALKEIMDGGGSDYVGEPGDKWGGGVQSSPMSFRQAKRHVYAEYLLVLKEAPFDLLDVNLLPSAGGCDRCPKRTGNCKELFPDLKNPDVCTDPACYKAKCGEEQRRRLAKEEEQGARLLPPKLAAKAFTNWGQLNEAYIEEDVVVREDKKQRTVEAIAKAAQVQRIAVPDNNGRIRTVYERAEIIAGAERLGIKFERREEPEKETPEKAAQREFEKKLEREICFTEVAALIKEVEKAPASDLDRWLYLRLWEDWSYNNDTSFILERRGYLDKETMGNMPGNQLRGLMLETTLGSYDDYNPQEIKAALKRYPKINAKAIEKEVKARLEKETQLPKHNERIKVEDIGVSPEDLNSMHAAVQVAEQRPIKSTFTFRGKQWAILGGLYGPDVRELEAWLVAPKFKTEPKEINPETGYHGVVVTFEKKEYSLSRPSITIVCPPEKKKGKK